MLHIWNFESVPSYKDYSQALVFAFFWPAIRFVLDRSLFEISGVSAVKKVDTSDNTSQGEQRAKIKFKESLWKLLYYSILEIYIVGVTASEPWALNTANFWENWPYQQIKFNLKLYYTAQCGFYVYSILALIFWETRRKDFSIMMTHHIVTVFLVSFSYVTSNFRVGSIVLALHDFSDIFLEAAKLFKYSGHEILASIFFGLFALSWLIMRLTYFPFWIIWSTSIECLQYIDKKDPWVPWEYYQFNTLLIILLVIHIYWWTLIFRMILRQVRNSGKVGDDVRSDSEDD